MRKVLVTTFLLLSAIIPAYAEEEEENLHLSPEKNIFTENLLLFPRENINESFYFFDFINRATYEETIDKDTEKRILREEWKDLLHGLDIFYPYFKTKEIEEWLGEKASIEIFNLKGKPKLEEDQIFYMFKIKL